jgi:hypothetical protein
MYLMSSERRLSMTLAVLLAVAGCGDSTAVPGPDAAQGDQCLFPKCVADLMKDCQPLGSCTMFANQSTTVVNYCLSSGVKILNSATTRGAEGIRVTRVMNGGRLCYTVEANSRGSVVTVAYRDGSGKLVATAAAPPGPSYSLTCTGEAEVMIPRVCGSPGDYPMGGMQAPSCKAGDCM